MVKISGHARKEMLRRGIEEEMVVRAIESGRRVMEERNGRFGVKRYSGLELQDKMLMVVWFYDENDEKHVVTVYWRGDRL